MRILTLIRHAKSDWKSGASSDHERPLNERGRTNAPEMGRRLKGRGRQLGLVLCSDAVRTRETMDLLLPELDGEGGKLKLEPSLYLASATSMLALASRQDDDLEAVTLVAHNPGTTELARRLGADVDNVTTCGVIEFHYPELSSWGDLGSARAAQVIVDLPKEPWSG